MIEGLTIREGAAGDLNYVLSSWLRNYRTSIKTRGIESEVYYDQQHGHHAAIVAALQRANVLCAGVEPGQVLGWVCYEQPNIVHYIHIKYDFQRLGVARALLAAAGLRAPLVVTHWHSACDRATVRGDKLLYNPYLFFRGLHAASKNTGHE